MTKTAVATLLTLLAATSVHAVRHAPAIQYESSAGDECDLDIEVSTEIAAGRHEYYCIWAMKAHRWLATAIKRMRAGRKDLVKWFILKNYGEEERAHVEYEVRKRLVKMQTGLENLYIEKGTECDVRRKKGGSQGTLAYVYPGQKRGDAFVVHVCDYAKEFKGDVSTKTLVHEISHHMGTVDSIERKSGNTAYGKTLCLALDAQRAANNADTYSLYVYGLAKRSRSETGLYEEGSGTPHASCNTGCDPAVWHYGEGGVQDLDLTPPLQHCLDCSWVRKENMKGMLAGWLGSNDTASGECGDANGEWRAIEKEDCDTIGCDYITSDSECKQAAAAFGLDFDLVRGKRARRKDAPFGCHTSDEGLFMNIDRRSDAVASPSDKMMCSCPTSQEYASTFGSRACCTSYECEAPK